MDYPFWDATIGHGILMALVAIVHVFISHFAIGGGLYLVVEETLARRKSHLIRLEFLQRLSRFFVLVTLVLGTLTGVGIWFVIGLLNPTATEVLIHQFVWAWAIEWTLFVVEIAAALVYYYGWNRMSARRHLQVGWIYFVSAWLSLAAINGIVGFMLTPGRWLETGALVDGFFNPTYWSSLVFRTGVCVLLAGVWAMLVATRKTFGAERADLVRRNAVWSTAGFLVVVPSALWYWRSVPAETTAAALGAIPTAAAALQAMTGSAVALAALLIVLGLFAPRLMNFPGALLAMAMALGSFGGFEWLRESLRKPYVISGFLYANSVEVARKDAYQTDGYLAHIAYPTGDAGADLFRYACRSCHTLDGYRALAPRLAGADRDFVAALVRGADAMRGNMPPFWGTADEAGRIADHLAGHVDDRPLAEITGLSGAALGERVFRLRCGTCHVPGGRFDNRESLLGLDRDEYADILDNGADFDDRMPDFTGADVDRKALLDWLVAQNPEAGP